MLLCILLDVRLATINKIRVSDQVRLTWLFSGQSSPIVKKSIWILVIINSELHVHLKERNA